MKGVFRQKDRHEFWRDLNFHSGVDRWDSLSRNASRFEAVCCNVGADDVVKVNDRKHFTRLNSEVVYLNYCGIG